MKIKYILYSFLLFLLSCREEFSLEPNLNNDILVVNGGIDNGLPPYTVKLSRSSDAANPKFIPVTGAILQIIDQDKNSEELVETSAGIYKSSEDGLKGKTGNKYKLYIMLPDGNEYETSYQTILKTTEIDTVYYDKKTEINDEFPTGLPGYSFFVNTKEAENAESYFLWKMTETYQYENDYELTYYMDSWGRKIYDTSRFDSLKVCWKTTNVKNFSTAATKNLSVPVIKRKQLHFVGTDTKKLTVLYSLLLKQYTINKSAYNFWSAVEDLLSDDNFLIGNQPYNLQGNVRNINDKNELVYGYFTVASVSEKRIFVNTIHAPFLYPRCPVITDKNEISQYKRTHQAPFYFVTIEGEDGQSTDALLYLPSCLDCRSNGGVTRKPDYWINY